MMTVHQTSSSNNVRSCTCPSYHAGTLLAAFLVVCIVERLQYRSSTDHLIRFSGIGSDLLVKKLNMSRFWCLFISAVVFTATQFAGAMISNPNTLVIVSGLTGIAYGFLFGVVPSLVAHTFGIGGLSQNWGFMILAPVLSGNVFNLLYGSIFDKHSVVGPDGERDCPDGLGCYQAAYYTTFFSGVAGIAVCLWSIMREKQVHSAQKKLEHDRLA